MSMPFLVFSCSACEYQGDDTVLWGQFSYEHQARRVPINRALGWCASCEDLSPIEVLPSSETIHQLQKEIEEKANRVNSHKAAAAQGRSWLGKLLGSQPRLPPEIQELDFQRSYAEDELKDERERLEFLRGRRSPPRCLFCGSVSWTRMPSGVQPSGTDEHPGPAIPIGINHPGCSGRLLVAHFGASMSKRLNHRLYDREGHLLRVEDSKPPKGRPTLDSSASLVDADTKNLLLSAAGNVGGDLCDLLLPAARTDEQSFVIALETGLFGVALASHIFAVLYAPKFPTLSLAAQIANAYCEHYTNENLSRGNPEGATQIKKYFESETQRALATTLGAIQMHEQNPEKLFWELSRVLASRMRINSRLDPGLDRINLAETKIRRSFEALMASLKAFRG